MEQVRLGIIGVGNMGSGPVSYTHLDVYKRQFPESSYKDVIRDYHIEVFVPPFTDEKQFVLFDYQHRDPLDQNAEIRKI